MIDNNLRLGKYNWLGLWTLCQREIKRFSKVGVQTVLAPVAAALIFLAIFAVALGRRRGDIAGVPFVEFLAPGLIMMAMIQNAFANPASSIMGSKMQGNIIDILMPPLTNDELIVGYAVGGLARGLAVGLLAGICMSFFVRLSPGNMGIIVFYAVATSLMLSLLGVMGGIWADKNEHLAVITSFVIMPLSFLSGTFYSIDRLPEGFQYFANFNPIFYAIDGFRSGFIDHADSPIWRGALVIVLTDLALWLILRRLLSTGYKLRA